MDSGHGGVNRGENRQGRKPADAGPGVDPVAGGFHDFKIGPERGVVWASTPALRPGEAGVLRLSDVPPGTYTFWCNILRHWDFGMVGTLTVAP